MGISPERGGRPGYILHLPYCLLEQENNMRCYSIGVDLYYLRGCKTLNADQ